MSYRDLSSVKTRAVHQPRGLTLSYTDIIYDGHKNTNNKVTAMTKIAVHPSQPMNYMFV